MEVGSSLSCSCRPAANEEEEDSLKSDRLDVSSRSLPPNNDDDEDSLKSDRLEVSSRKDDNITATAPGGTSVLTGDEVVGRDAVTEAGREGKAGFSAESWRGGNDRFSADDDCCSDLSDRAGEVGCWTCCCGDEDLLVDCCV